MDTDEHKQLPAHKANGKISVLHQAVLHSFPVAKYTGKITNYDNDWVTQENEDLDDEMFLYKAVHGRLWTEVSKDYLQKAPDGFVLLSDEAFPAFFPAWLMDRWKTSAAKIPFVSSWCMHSATARDSFDY